MHLVSNHLKYIHRYAYLLGEVIKAMSPKSELMHAQEALAAVLDAKIGNMPEWKAYRAIQRALMATDAQSNGVTPYEPIRTRHKPGEPLSYTALTDAALKERGKPIPTPALIEFIGRHRDIGSDAERAKINITSTLSKSPAFVSVAWEGGRAWWYADRPVPK